MRLWPSDLGGLRQDGNRPAQPIDTYTYLNLPSWHVQLGRRHRPRVFDRPFGRHTDLIEAARQLAARAINSQLAMLYWQIGTRIRREILSEERAEYGEEVVSALSRKLTADYGKGFSRSNLFHMIALAAAFPDETIVQTLSGQLSWSHFIEIVALKEPLQRDFYAETCRLERWSVRTLREKIRGMLYERTGLSRKPAQLAAQELRALRDEDRMTPDLVFRDPYLLDFLGLADTYRRRNGSRNWGRWCWRTRGTHRRSPARSSGGTTPSGRRGWRTWGHGAWWCWG